jgi:hypothetical protein
MFNSYYIISEFNSKIELILKKNSKIHVIYRPKINEYNDQILKRIIKTNIYNKIYLANKSNICPIKGLAGVYISAVNKKIIISSYFKDKSVIGSAHSIREICKKINSKCNIIFFSPILKKKNNIKTPIGLIKFLLISKYFKNITLVPLGGIYNPVRLKNYDIRSFAGVKFFEEINKRKFI